MYTTTDLFRSKHVRNKNSQFSLLLKTQEKGVVESCDVTHSCLLWSPYCLLYLQPLPHNGGVQLLLKGKQVHICARFWHKILNLHNNNVHTHTYTYVHTHVHVHTYADEGTYIVCVCVCVCVYVCVCVCRYMCTYSTYMYTYKT